MNKKSMILSALLATRVLGVGGTVSAAASETAATPVQEIE